MAWRTIKASTWQHWWIHPEQEERVHTVGNLPRKQRCSATQTQDDPGLGQAEEMQKGKRVMTNIHCVFVK